MPLQIRYFNFSSSKLDRVKCYSDFWFFLYISWLFARHQARVLIVYKTQITINKNFNFSYLSTLSFFQQWSLSPMLIVSNIQFCGNSSSTLSAWSCPLEHNLPINLISVVLQTTTNSKSSQPPQYLGNLSRLWELVSLMVLT